MTQIEFNDNFHPEFDGYISEDGKGVWISFIVSKQEGKGNFRNFIEEMKSKYDWIKIPTPSTRMFMIAIQNGFKPKKEYFEPVEEWCDVLVWNKELSKKGEGEMP